MKTGQPSSNIVPLIRMDSLSGPEYDLAIIGAGFSGSMVAINALAAARLPLRIALINKSADFGRGIAYGTRCPSHLLNVPAARMSAFVAAPDDFYLWLEEHRALCEAFGVGAARKDQFIPRALFGGYVSELLERRTRDTAAGTVLKKIVADVQDVQECPGGMRVWLDADESITARKVVLAPGNFPPGDPPLRDRAIFRSRCYLGQPWLGQRMDRVRRAREVLILGAGLTAVDLILSMREEGCEAHRIHLLSRHGRWPQPHRAAPPYPAFLPEGQGRPRTIRELFRRVRAEVRRAGEKGIDWRPVLDALRGATPALWHGLDRANKRRFLRHARSLWETHRHRVPPDILAEIERLEAAGTVVRHAGRIESMRTIDGGDRVRVVYRDARQATHELEVDLVVNCTGPESNYRKLDDPLIINLLARGLVHPDPLLLGLDVAPNGALASVAGNYSSTFYTLGSPRRGQLYETTAVPELRQQAQRLARELVRDLQPPVPALGVASFEI